MERFRSDNSKIDVLYDGHCAICNRAIHFLSRLDLLNRLDFTDFRALNLNNYNAVNHVELYQKELEHRMHVISHGQVYQGFFGCRKIAFVIPLFWLIVPVLYLPGISKFGVIFYDYLASQRFRLMKCDATCHSQISDR